MPAPQALQTIGGRFRVVSTLGHGAAGIVYLVEDTYDGRRVALKLLQPQGQNRVRAFLRFKREFSAIAKLSHPHCITVYEMGEQDGQLFYTMEYIQGRLVARDLRNLPLDDLLTVILQVLAALDHVHNHGIVHRDLKPQNILLARGDSGLIAKLADFGVASSSEEENTVLSQAG